MQNAVNEALADIRVEPAGHLLGEVGLTHASWTHALEHLEATGRSIVPRGIPTQPAREVLTYRLQSTFGFLLDTAARFLESGGEEDAERTAHEARTIKALTVAPGLRHRREEAAPAGATRAELLDHRVTAEGNGFLALSVAELTAAIGPVRKARGQLPAVLPPDPAAFVVLWKCSSRSACLMRQMACPVPGVDPGVSIAKEVPGPAGS
ncbi:hypothetical protein ACWECC_36845 [Streptomyces microflavus]